MQQKFLKIIKINGEKKMSIFEKKCKKLPIDRCKNLLSILLKTRNDEKNFDFRKNVNVLLGKGCYSDSINNVKVFFHNISAVPLENRRYFCTIKPVQIPIKWPEKKFLNVNDFFRNIGYSDNVYIHTSGYHIHLNKLTGTGLRKKRYHIFSKNLQYINDFFKNSRYSDDTYVFHSICVYLLYKQKSGTDLRKKRYHIFSKNLQNVNGFLGNSRYSDYTYISSGRCFFYFNTILHCIIHYADLRKKRHFFSKNLQNVNGFLGNSRYSGYTYISSGRSYFHSNIILHKKNNYADLRKKRHFFSKNLQNVNDFLGNSRYHVINRNFFIYNHGAFTPINITRRHFFSKKFCDLLEFQRKKIRNVNDFLTITRYSKNKYIHINKFLKISFGVRNPVPHGEKAPVSMFKKSIYIINVFINHSTDALRAPSINKIGDYLYTTIFRKELLVLFFNLLKKYFDFYLHYPKSIKLCRS